MLNSSILNLENNLKAIKALPLFVQHSYLKQFHLIHALDLSDPQEISTDPQVSLSALAEPRQPELICILVAHDSYSNLRSELFELNDRPRFLLTIYPPW